MRVEGWIALAADLVALAALVLVVLVWRRQARWHAAQTGPAPHPSLPAAPPSSPLSEPTSGPLLAFVVNPAKPDAATLRLKVLAACAGRYLREPLWLETTVEDPGAGQARQAVAAGAQIVVAVGGDGTVRAVAGALAGTGTPMGIIPLGTGNLLARNIDVPLADPLDALHVVLDGKDKPIDVGRLHVDRWDPEQTGVHERDHLFLVIAGIGFDAAMVADTDDVLKAKVGWIAYFFAGVRHLHGSRTRVRVALDERPTQTARVRSLLIGNCGRLPGGITLLPDAVLDDGWLDVAAIDTRGGLAGWAQLFGEVVLQGAGYRSTTLAKIGRIDHVRTRVVQLHVRDAITAQVDGDLVGDVLALTVRVEPGALVLRVPA
ncbi:MAG: NAD(+)/NADH kinase [Actinobacteria bacterium]|nr:NAD(+)/NADH kinase [Actinomycetota bacterium]